MERKKVKHVIKEVRVKRLRAKQVFGERERGEEGVDGQ